MEQTYELSIAGWNVFCERCRKEGHIGDLYGQDMDNGDIHCIDCVIEAVNQNSRIKNLVEI